MPTMHARTDILLGKTIREKLADKCVLIAGLGGVGGQAAEAIARSGIGHLRLIDADVFSPSNLNRQLLATQHTIGMPKTKAAYERFLSIDPNLDIEIIDRFLPPDTNAIAPLLEGVDYVLDCIDTIACKVALILAAQAQNIPLISAMGAGNKLEVSQVSIAPLNKTYNCKLAQQVRHRLRKAGGRLDYPVVFSKEIARPPIAKVVGSGEGARSVNGTISYMPALFGIMMAGQVVRDLSQD